jgi:arylsulfatase A-like enzyme
VPDSDLWREQLKSYFAAVTAMDANIGRLLDRVDTLGPREDTLVVFLSDNGFSTGHHGIWGKGNATFPLNMYDNSVLVPAIFRLPGAIPAGVVRSEMVSGLDFAHTLLELAGLAMPNADALPGQSFARLLEAGNAGGGRDHVVIFDEYGPVRMIRTEQWKYVHRYPYGPHELYDMVNDPDERTNRIDDGACEEIVVELRGRLDAWFVRYVDPAVDGAREPVTGTGQRDLAGPANGGRLAFEQDQRLQKEAQLRGRAEVIRATTP